MKEMEAPWKCDWDIWAMRGSRTDGQEKLYDPFGFSKFQRIKARL